MSQVDIINALPDLYYTNGNTIPKIDGGGGRGRT